MRVVVGKLRLIGERPVTVIGPPSLAVGDVHVPERATHTTVLDELCEEQA